LSALDLTRSEEIRRVDPVETFRARCEARALLFKVGELDLHDCVDVLQADAEARGLVRALGQDTIQTMLAEAF
jgi:hypothetical protein